MIAGVKKLMAVLMADALAVWVEGAEKDGRGKAPGTAADGSLRGELGPRGEAAPL